MQKDAPIRGGEDLKDFYFYMHDWFIWLTIYNRGCVAKE